MKRLDSQPWTTIATAAAILQAIVLWQLVRTATPGGQVVRLLLIVAVTLLLPIALIVRERDLNRELHVAAERLRLAMSSGHAVAWDWDLKSGRDVLVGDLKTMFGIDAEMRVIGDFSQYVHSEDRARVWKAMADAREQHTRYEETFRLVRADGTIRWIAARGQFYYAASGEPVRMLGVAADVTDQRVIEAQLRESEQLLAGIVESAMDAIIAFDEQQVITVFNPAAERIFGCPSSVALGMPVDRFIPRRFREQQTSGTTSILGQPKALRYGGEPFPFDASMSKAVVGGRTFWTIILRDVTERYHADAARRESEQRFQLLADASTAMLWLAAPDKRLTYVNRSWLEFTGRPLVAELGDGWLASVHPDDRERCLATYEEAFDRRDPFTMEYRLRRYDGEYRWVQDSGVPRFMADGSFAGYAGSAVDVTAQKSAQAALADLSHKLMEAHESERTRIARELHDDIGQRMAVLTMELDGLNQALPLPTADLRTRIRALAERTIDLGKDVQAISHRVHSFKLEYMGLAGASASFCRELSARQPVAIVFTHSHVPDDLPRDVALCMFRVLQEAVTNAVKHAGVDRVAATLTGGPAAIELEVVDTGRGFDPEAAMRGPGLGLVSMRERLSLVKGELSIRSQPHAGTTVRARVPMPQLNSLASA